MYAVSEGRIKINEKMVDTYGRAALGKSTALHVVAGTTGFKGSNRREAGGRTYLKIECCCGDFHFIPEEDEDGLPKASREGHGIGLASISAIARKYGGSLNMSTDKSTLHATVLLYAS